MSGILPAFQAFTVKTPGRASRITTEVVVTPAFDPKTQPPPAAKHTTIALWDTGASRSAISPAIVQALSLVPVGTVKVQHAGGTSDSPTYLVNFRLPNSVAVVGIIVSEFSGMPGAGGFDVLIGMDIITFGDLAITNLNGKTCMSFRTPSMKQIDYVTEHNEEFKRAFPKNKPCFCGARDKNGDPVKFKLCHGK